MRENEEMDVDIGTGKLTDKATVLPACPEPGWEICTYKVFHTQGSSFASWNLYPPGWGVLHGLRW